MKAADKYEELKAFLLYHVHNNPDRKLKDILPLAEELFRTLGEPVKQIKKGK